MNNFISFLTICLLLLNGNSGSVADNNPPHLDCNDYWLSVAFGNFCSMTLGNFDLSGVNDICGADSNDSYQNDELIYINVYNNFTESSAIEEYNLEKEAFESNLNFVEVSSLGDEAFTAITVTFGRLDGAYIVMRKGIYTVTLEVNGNAANDSDNCFTPTTILNLAEALIAPL